MSARTNTTKFDALVYPDPNSGCWLWAGYLNSKGYGRLRMHPYGKVLAHVASYRRHVGEIPAGKELDHKCRNRACVNPAHLEPVTHAENMHRGAQATKTHCNHGHEYAVVGSEFYYRKDVGQGVRYRRCLACYSARYPRTQKHAKS